MLLQGATPSGVEYWLALSRMPSRAPDCALPTSASLPSSPWSKLLCCAFQVFSVNPGC